MINSLKTSEPTPEMLKIFEAFLRSEGKNYADAQTAEEKLKAADEMYGKMMVLFLANLGIEGEKNRPVSAPLVQKNTTPTVIFNSSVTPESRVVKKIKNVPEQKKSAQSGVYAQFTSGRLDFKFYSQLRTLKAMNIKDPRLKQLRGFYTGSLQFKNTEVEDKATFEMKLDPVTVKLNVIPTDQIRYPEHDQMVAIPANDLSIFKEIPGESNLIVMSQSPTHHYLIDISLLPALKMKYYSLNFVRAEFVLRKRND